MSRVIGIYGYSVALVLLVLTISNTCYSSPLQHTSPGISTIGEQIYHSGKGDNNRPVVATGAGNTISSGSKSACVNCHRRSGYGTSEGGLLVPSITGNFLFNKKDFQYRELRSSNARPVTRNAYTTTSLKRAIREGIDANGRKLDHVMPRYQLSDKELDQLISYLESLDSESIEGIDEDNIHLATIITPDTSVLKRKSHLDTLDAYIKAKNSESRLEQRRKKNTPWHKKWQYSSYRKWQLHTWELTGDEETWTQQLNSYYQQQPVFSIISGVGETEWRPVHIFCEQKKLPCLFPSTSIPVVDPGNLYNLYFSRGVYLEADVIASHISSTKTTAHIIQISDNNRANKVAASRTLSILSKLGNKNIESYSADYFRKNYALINNKFKSGNSTVVILWADTEDLLGLLNNDSTGLAAVYTSTGNIKNRHNQATSFPFFVAHRHVQNAELDKKLLRLNAWLKGNKIVVSDLHVAANTYFAVNLLNTVLKHMRNNFSREYLIERIEHMVENSPFESTYTTLSLGAEQRFASKGAYITGPLSDISQLWESNVPSSLIIPDN